MNYQPHTPARSIVPRPVALLASLLVAGGCDSWQDTDRTLPSVADAVIGVPGEIALTPGPSRDSSASDVGATVRGDAGGPGGGTIQNPYSDDADAIAEGRRLYTWYNCGACHGALGGGGMGPPLRDGQWIYGGDAVSIYRSIMQGRPEGMPGWLGQIPDDQVWRIVAFIQALESDDFDFEPPLRPPRSRIHPSALENAQLSPTEP